MIDRDTVHQLERLGDKETGILQTTSNPEVTQNYDTQMFCSRNSTGSSFSKPSVLNRELWYSVLNLFNSLYRHRVSTCHLLHRPYTDLGVEGQVRNKECELKDIDPLVLGPILLVYVSLSYLYLIE